MANLVRNDSVAVDVRKMEATTASTATLNKTEVFSAPKDDKLGFLLKFFTTITSTSTGIDGKVTVTAGDDGLAWQNGYGSETFTLSSTNLAEATDVYELFIGPFETARFGVKSTTTTIAAVGSPTIKLTFETYASSIATTTPHGTTDAFRNMHVYAFRMP